MLVTAAAVGVSTAATAHAQLPSCTPYLLPGLPGGQGGGVAVVSDSGLYAGQAGDAGGNLRAVYWTHSGPDLASGWAIHLVPSGLVHDFIGDVNAHGLMVGAGEDPVTGVGRTYVFDATTGTLTWLPDLGGGFSEARRLNSSGEAAGFSVDTHGVGYAVTWTPPYTNAVKLPVVGGAQSAGTQNYAHFKIGSIALGIDDLGRTVGQTAIGAPVDGVAALARNGFWRGGLSPLLQPVAWAANGAPRKLPVGWAQGQAWAINDDGLIVGSADLDSAGVIRPAYWINGQYHDMGAAADIQFGNAYGLNGDWAAGIIVLADGTARAFVWTGAGSVQTLEPTAGFADSFGHAPNQSLDQVGGSMTNDPTRDSTGAAAVWQCPSGFTTG
jgi:hypothetical protein